MDRVNLKKTGVLISIIPLMLILSISLAYTAFNHQAVSGYALEGKHAKIKCNACHIKEKDYKGTPANCISCHKNRAHRDKVFGRDCKSCHTAEGWKDVAMDMKRHPFPVGHRGARGCKDCHPRTVKEYTCYECHEHRPSKMEREHLEEGIRDYNNCMRCHPTGLEHERQRGEGEGRRWRRDERGGRIRDKDDRHHDGRPHDGRRRYYDDDSDHYRYRRYKREWDDD